MWHAIAWVHELSRVSLLLVSVPAAYADAVVHRGSPAVVLAQAVKGYALGPNFGGRNATHQMKKMTPDQMCIFRGILAVPMSDAELADGLPPYLPLPKGSTGLDHLRTRRDRVGALSARHNAKRRCPTSSPDLWVAPFTALGTDGSGFSDTREAFREYFGTDAVGVARAALASLADAGPAVTSDRPDTPLAASRSGQER